MAQDIALKDIKDVTPIYNLLYDEKFFFMINQTIDNSDAVSAEVTNVVAVGELKQDEKILDLCCGRGYHTLELAKRGYTQVVGLDIYPPLLVEAINVQATIPAASSAVFHVGNGQRMDQFQDASFDKILLLGNSLSYINQEDRVALLKEAGRVLKKEGLLVVDNINFEQFASSLPTKTWNRIDKLQYVLHEKEISGTNRSVISRSTLLTRDKGFIMERVYSERIFSHDELANLLQEAGFYISRTQEAQGTKVLISATLKPDFIPEPRPYPSEVKPVPYGKGVFAARDIGIGEVVQRFSGPLMAYEKVPLEDQIYVCWTNGLYTNPVTYSRYFNHSCDPNCVTNSVREIVAKRPITQGEELSFCYNLSDEWDFWDPKWNFECFCGAEKCQKMIDCYVDKFGNKLIEPINK